MSESGKILVGTASWADPGFVEHWYPKGMRAGDRLAWYAHHFEMVEVNSTFYAVPDQRMVERWCAQTPDAFIFDVKLHQLLSRHSTPAKLLPPELQRAAQTDEKGRVKLSPEIEEAVTDRFLRSVNVLRSNGKLGALLLQLSPSFSPNKNRLEELDQLLKATNDYQLAIEFRNRNWVSDDQLAATVGFLTKHSVIFVNVDAPLTEHFTIMPSGINEVTNHNVSYLRLHGRDPNAYLRGKTVATRFHYDYSGPEIEEVAERSRALARSAREVHVVFNNNALDYAPRAAARLRTALGQIIRPLEQTPELF
ncbi:MAG: hypothetical protein QOG67_3086 [Verrucomicrobiota bacterium]|jgi:uncharacterized protein YecE (DUF72 family)